MTADLDREGMGSRFVEALGITRMQQNEIAEMIHTTNAGVNSYIKGRAIPRAEVILRLMESFPNINWFYVIFGDQYGSITSTMPIASDVKEKDRVIEDLQKEIQSMNKVLRLQEESIKDKERIIRSLEKNL